MSRKDQNLRMSVNPKTFSKVRQLGIALGNKKDDEVLEEAVNDLFAKKQATVQEFLSELSE